MVTSSDHNAREVQPTDRFTWERVLLRARLTGVIGGSGRVNEETGKATRGGISAAVFKAVSLTYSMHADEDGSNVRPGDMRVAVLTEVHHQTVKAVREKLIEFGMMRQTGRHGHTPRYRLTLPSDLTEWIDVLSPDEVVETAKARRKKSRDAKAKSRNGYASGIPKDEAMGTPAAYPKAAADDHEDPVNGYAAGTPKSENGYASGNDMGTPPEALNQVRTGTYKITTENPGVDLRTDVTGPSDPEEPPPDPRPKKCPTHGLGGGIRPDGLPECTFCRRDQRAEPPIAPVVDLDSRRTA